MRLEEVSARVLVAGGFAETTLEITIGNSEDRVVEAYLDLPLPEGASISSYALEVDGKLREGTIVGKQTARVAFEETTRQKIDPGLLEKTTGNHFRFFHLSDPLIFDEGEAPISEARYDRTVSFVASAIFRNRSNSVVFPAPGSPKRMRIFRSASREAVSTDEPEKNG